MVYGFEGMGRFSNISALLEHPTFLPRRPPPAPPGKGGVKGTEKTLPQSDEAVVFLPAQKVPLSEYPYLVIGLRERVSRPHSRGLCLARADAPGGPIWRIR